MFVRKDYVTNRYSESVQSVISVLQPQWDCKDLSFGKKNNKNYCVLVTQATTFF